MANPIERELYSMLLKLDEIGEAHDEIGDTEVRDLLGSLVRSHFIKGEKLDSVPTSLGMFSKEADEKVRAVLTVFFTSVLGRLDEESLNTPQKRFAAFQDTSIRTDVGKSDYEEFFGHYECLP